MMITHTSEKVKKMYLMEPSIDKDFCVTGMKKDSNQGNKQHHRKEDKVKSAEDKKVRK